MTQLQFVELQGQLIAKHAVDWPQGPLTGLQLMHALAAVIKDALREGERIGINETSANAQRQFAQMQKPAVLWPAG